MMFVIEVHIKSGMPSVIGEGTDAVSQPVSHRLADR